MSSQEDQESQESEEHVDNLITRMRNEALRKARYIKTGILNTVRREGRGTANVALGQPSMEPSLIGTVGIASDTMNTFKGEVPLSYVGNVDQRISTFPQRLRDGVAGIGTIGSAAHHAAYGAANNFGSAARGVADNFGSAARGAASLAGSVIEGQFKFEGGKNKYKRRRIIINKRTKRRIKRNKRTKRKRKRKNKRTKRR